MCVTAGVCVTLRLHGCDMTSLTVPRAYIVVQTAGRNIQPRANKGDARAILLGLGPVRGISVENAPV